MPSAKRWIDLHSHSTASDGSMTPAKLVEASAQIGVSALALTDHDTLAGLPEAERAAKALGVEIVRGVEISATRAGGGSLHVLGFFVALDDLTLAAALDRLIDARDHRNARIVKRLAELGMPIDLAAVEASAGGSVGRPHLAQALVDRGFVASLDEAFDRWLADGRPAYVDKEILSPAEAARAIHAAGGVATIAHPLTYGRAPEQAEALCREAVAAGIDGIEVHYGAHSQGEIEMLACFADRYRLLRSGGSDFHREPRLRAPGLPPERFEALRARAGERAAARVS